MALPLIVAGVTARAAAKKVATTVAKKSAAKAKSNTVVKKVSKGIENQKFKKIKEESNDFYKIARAVGRGEDPVKAAKAMIAIAEREQPLMHFFLGQDAYDLAYAKMKTVKNDLEDAKELSISTGF